MNMQCLIAQRQYIFLSMYSILFIYFLSSIQFNFSSQKCIKKLKMKKEMDDDEERKMVSREGGK